LRLARDAFSQDTLPASLQFRRGTVSSPAIVHSYPLAVRNCGLFSAFGLLLRSLPYALIRFAVLLAFSFASIIWVVLTLGGSVWLGAHVAPAFGWVWFISGALLAGWFWMASLRYFLHLIECGHVAVLTQLIVRGRVGNGTESMFAYGRRIVTEHFGQVNVLFAMNLLVRGVLNTFHRTLDWIAEVLPIPGLGAIANLLTAILRAATRYMDKVILSYNLARNDENPWNSARAGIVYYCQNARPILKTAVWIVVAELALSIILWLLLLGPAAAITVMLPQSVRGAGALPVIIAVLFALAARGAFVKPLFLIMILVRFHTAIEGQPIRQDWVARLDQLSSKFRNLEQKAQTYTQGTPTNPAPQS
jgi:hypothetical protein